MLARLLFLLGMLGVTLAPLLYRSPARLKGIAVMLLFAAALSCAIVGDSIAEDLALYMHQCAVNAKIGIGSAAIIERVPAGYGLVVISSGSNDPQNSSLEKNLRAARERATGRVIWILPADQRARATVIRVASERGDPVIGFPPGRDGVHPKSYQDLAAFVFGSLH
jgi:hypothetical protein